MGVRLPIGSILPTGDSFITGPGRVPIHVIIGGWILTSGFWNDTKTWIDTEYWID